jgi:putative membrane protein
LRAAAEASTAVTTLEQASFLAAGFLLWRACFHTGALAGAAGLVFTSMHMTLLGALLALSPRPLYGSDPVTCLGLTLGPAQDQQLGGTLMLLVGAVVYLAGGVALIGRSLAGSAAR